MNEFFWRTENEIGQPNDLNSEYQKAIYEILLNCKITKITFIGDKENENEIAINAGSYSIENIYFLRNGENDHLSLTYRGIRKKYGSISLYNFSEILSKVFFALKNTILLGKTSKEAYFEYVLSEKESNEIQLFARNNLYFGNVEIK